MSKINKVRVFGNFLSEIPCSALISKDKYAFHKKRQPVMVAFFYERMGISCFPDEVFELLRRLSTFRFREGRLILFPNLPGSRACCLCR